MRHRRTVGIAENKTQITDVDPAAFIASVGHPVRRADAETPTELMTRVTGCAPKMWGPSMVGFGRYHHRYDSGREGDDMLTGCAHRTANLVVYVMPGYDDLDEPLGGLGKYRRGRSSRYTNKLADVDLEVLEEVVAAGVTSMRASYETFDE